MSNTTGTALGGQPPATTLGGTALGGAPKTATTLGGSSLGGPAKKPTTLGGATSLGGSTLGGSTLGGSSLGGTPATTTGNSLGGSSLGGSSLGGSTLGGAAKKSGSKNKKKKKAGEKGKEGDADDKDEGDETETKTDAADAKPDGAADKPAEDKPEEKKDEKKAEGGAKKGDKKKAAPAPTKAPAKGGPKSKIAAQILKAKAEQEKLQREEEERIKREEEEEERRIAELKRQEEERKKQAEERKKRQKEAAEDRKKKEAEARRAELASKFGGNVVIPGLAGGGAKRPKPRKNNKGKKPGDQTATEDASTETQANNNTTQGEQPKQQAESWEDQLGEAEDWEAVAEKVVAVPTETEEKPALSREEEEKIKAEEERKRKEEEAKRAEDDRRKRDEERRRKHEEQKRRQEEDRMRKQREEQEKKEKLEKIRKGQGGEDDLRSPIVVVLGHVDTGKTSLLDRIRRTSYQNQEVGGITQQIGATFFPMENVKEKTLELREDETFKSLLKWDIKYQLPGLLIIDTPGHESFSNLRVRGSSLCDIAILVVDLMHGLEPQTIESINLLKKRKIPFIVALNKVDRCYGWKPTADLSFLQSFKNQGKDTQMEFDDRVKQTVAGFAEQGLNAALYYKNPDFRKFISLVPTSAVSGEGIPDLLLLLIQLSQNMMTDRLLKLTSLQCTILEVKVIEGFGYTVDVILANGILREGDRIMLCGWNGPIITTVRALLTPQPMKEIRFKSQYIHHKEVRAAQGVKISAQDLEGAVAGSQLYVINDIEEDEDAMEDLKETVMEDVKGLLEKLDRSGVGVTVQASTLGSLEALLEYLNKTCKVPVANINIGPVHKRDVVKASVMHDRKAPEFACILAFDVKVTPEAEQFAQDMKVRTFEADIIYHLFDKFTRYWEDVKKEKLANAKVAPVFPCILRIYEEYIFNKRNPIILGVHVEDGILKVGTPICVPTKECIELGTIASIEKDHKTVQQAKAGDDVAIKIDQAGEQQNFMYGRHFEHDDLLYSKITRDSLDALKEFHKDVVQQKEIYTLLVKMKKVLGVL